MQYEAAAARDGTRRAIPDQKHLLRRGAVVLLLRSGAAGDHDCELLASQMYSEAAPEEEQGAIPAEAHLLRWEPLGDHECGLQALEMCSVAAAAPEEG